MSVESWNPGAGLKTQRNPLTPATLLQLIDYSVRGALPELETLLIGSERQALSQLMKIDHSYWIDATEHLSDDQLIHLIRFLTVAENLPGWEVQDKSPAIPLAKILRKRGIRLDKDFLRWLREVSSNRFLPYGPL